jgi:4-hydroxybenzoate polyprenyltransferase
MPWALAGLFLGARGMPSGVVFLWVMAAMVGARTAAMTFNRLVDRSFDARNPRTATRGSVTGAVSVPFMAVATIAAVALFFLASHQLNELCFYLAFPTLVVLLGYSYCKRFTSLSHVVLGIALGLSPVGAYLAVRGAFDQGSLAAIGLGLCVLAWTAGFDIMYACQDMEHDRALNLRSIPARLGIPRSLVLARWFHGAVPLLLVLSGALGDLRWIYFGGVIVSTLLLIYEHRLVRADDLSRLQTAFFGVNVAIALVTMTALILDLLLLQSHHA